MSADRALLAVVVGHGAVGLADLLLGLDVGADLLFVVPETADPAPYRAVLGSAGTVLVLSGDPARDAAQLCAAAPDGIVTFSERALPATTRLAAAAGLPFHSPATVDRLTDKHRQRRAMREHGIATPDSWLLRDARDWPDDVRLPAVVKPARGEGSRNTHLVHSVDEGRALVRRLLDPALPSGEQCLVVEEFLVGVPCEPFGDYVSVESLCSGGAVHAFGVTGKLPLLPPFRETGQFVPAALSPTLCAEVEQLAERALRALDVGPGITHTEIKLTAEGPRVIEVNGRIGGFLDDLYQRATGVSLIEVAGRVALGQSVDPPDRALGGVYFQHYARPPVDATALTAVQGTRELLRCPGITGHRQLVAPGSSFPEDGTAVYLCLTAGEASSHEQMLEVLDAALARTRYTFATPNGPVSASGTDLRAAS